MYLNNDALSTDDIVLSKTSKTKFLSFLFLFSSTLQFVIISNFRWQLSKSKNLEIRNKCVYRVYCNICNSKQSRKRKKIRKEFQMRNLKYVWRKRRFGPKLGSTVHSELLSLPMLYTKRHWHLLDIRWKDIFWNGKLWLVSCDTDRKCFFEGAADFPSNVRNRCLDGKRPLVVEPSIFLHR